jgi:exodeoxyribonuclease-3
MKLATWNVNSLKVRLPHLFSWLEQSPADVICLQETKLEDKSFPQAELEAAGYQVAFSGQKTYNGVAIVSRHPLSAVLAGNPHFADEQKRLIAATVTPAGQEPLRVICAYVPNGQEVGSDKYAYKLAWLAALKRWLAEELAAHPRLAIAGDYNIAPDDRDVHDPVAWAGKILCSDAERAAFSALVDLGLADAFRLFEQPERSFSWWDYRMMGFRRNHGLRIDHLLLSKALRDCCTACAIDRGPRGWERPSDHTPVVATLSTGACA